MEILTLAFLKGLIAVILIDLVMSGDNAMVIGLASRNLPPDQRKKAIFWGTTGAVVLRIVCTILVVYLLQVPYLQLGGGLLLVWIAVKLLAENGDGHSNVKEGVTFWGAMRTIIVADLVLSIDNILGVAGAATTAGEGHSLTLVIIGLIVSVPIMIWGSSVIQKAVNKFPALIYAGSGVLGWASGKMIVHDTISYIPSGQIEISYATLASYGIPALTIALVIVVGKALSSRKS